jgi:hypothetical protein
VDASLRSRFAASCALATLVACISIAGCRPAPGASTAPAPFRSAAGDADVRALLLDSAASGLLCSRLTDRFVGLPASGLTAQAGDGNTPLDGRWWIRSCTTRTDGRSLLLQVAGPGWYWVDEERSGFRVRQYVGFKADVGMVGALDVGYDPSTRLASIWFTPASPGQVRVEPTGQVVPHAVTLFAEAVDLLTLGTLPSAEARNAVEVEGAQRFRDRLALGVTVTLDMSRMQYDLQLGQLPRGATPRRPFTDGAPWWVNERQRFFPGGAHVTGPFEAGPAVVDVVVEQGSGLRLLGVCLRDLQQILNAPAANASSIVDRVAFLDDRVLPGGLASRSAQAQCPWYLVTRALSVPGTPPSAVAALRLRSAPGPAGQVATHAAIIRVTLVGFHIEAKKPNGDAWDVGGGAPDPTFTLVHGRVNYPFGRRWPDAFDGTVVLAAPEPLEVTAAAPVHIVATDEDIAFNDPIGTAEVTLADTQKGPEVTKPLMNGAAVTGSVRVRIDVVATQ